MDAKELKLIVEALADEPESKYDEAYRELYMTNRDWVEPDRDWDKTSRNWGEAFCE